MKQPSLFAVVAAFVVMHLREAAGGRFRRYGNVGCFFLCSNVIIGLRVCEGKAKPEYRANNDK